MRKILVLILLLCSILLTGCMLNRGFEIHEWGVFIKGYNCDNTSVLSEPPGTFFVKKPVIYFHGVENKTNIKVKIDSIRNTTTVPEAYIVNDQIIWNVEVEDNKVVASNGTRYPYLFYEGEINYSTNIKAEILVSRDNITFYVKNNEDYTITDVYMIYGYSAGDIPYLHRGLTYTRIDELKSGEEKKVSMKLRDNLSYNLKELQNSLLEKGLTEEETQDLINYWKDWWFYPTNTGIYTRLLYIIPQTVYDKLLSITVTPIPSSIVRIGIVTLTDIPIIDTSNLSLILSTDKTSYHTDDNVNITLRVVNNGNRDITLIFPDTQVIDFNIIDETGEQVYLWSYGKMFAQVVTNITIPLGESRVLLNDTWIVDVEGENYTIQGWLMTTPRIYSNSIMVTISQ